MHGATHDGFINVNVTIPYLEIETTLWIGAHPRLVAYGCPLGPKIGQGHKVTGLAFLALWEIELFQRVHLPA
jgi:hypothetical protein